ncbi:FUSC family protein [Marisediminicola senii]|uniref:FUSC family protein n=1 Tax=Marisediminicola senii TaxID=2711233 RepID=UPI0013EA68AC|nr:FUSC family protein [Marisediminicola senii]
MPPRGLLRHFDVRGSVDRAGTSIIPALQIVVAATAAYAIARYLLGHEIPLIAVTVTISSLGFVRDARPVRVLESAIGIVIGIVLSELLLVIVGQGLWQIGVVLFITLVVARFLSASNAFAVAAGVQSMLVMVLPAPDGGPFLRSVDGLIGGTLALIVTAVIPRDPRRLVRRDAKRLFEAFINALDSVQVALDTADEPAADRALEKLRATQPTIDAWESALDSATAIARISPFHRRRVPELEGHARVLRGMDLATRNLRVISRRIDFLVRDGRHRPELGSLVGRLATSVRLLGDSLDDPLLGDTVRVGLVSIAERLTPESVEHDDAVIDSAVILMFRPLLVDLMTAAGMSEERARQTLPDV